MGFILARHAQTSSKMKTFHLKHQLSVVELRVVHSVYVGYKNVSQLSCAGAGISGLHAHDRDGYGTIYENHVTNQ